MFLDPDTYRESFAGQDLRPDCQNDMAAVIAHHRAKGMKNGALAQAFMTAITRGQENKPAIIETVYQVAEDLLHMLMEDVKPSSRKEH